MADKRQLLIDTALDLFYRFGINTIGINEVLKVSKVAKKTLYTHFESKDALILASLKQRDAIFVDWLTNEINGHPTNEAMISALFDALDNWFNNRVSHLCPFRGCFFINTSAEFSEEETEISRYCLAHKTKIKNRIKEAMPREDESLLDNLCLVKEGAIVSAYVSRDLNAAKKAKAMFLKEKHSI
ncbi:TetR/AcrR family transcriptional regulator [Vibrio sonorensis]|uniref:TetR/AcrR family transcriptional regulator n=1 Tax=Vibrio sonorensis TaxID=1004316 RepID=UPI0008DB128B|nr:TetR/AcrR family transcriptional regulator [Vibrio sonorensis]